MRFMKPDESVALTEKMTEGCPDTGLYGCWSGVLKWMLPAFSVIAVIYGNLVVARHPDEMYLFFYPVERWQMGLYWVAFFVIAIPLLVAVHELLHVIVLPHRMKNVTVVFDLPRTVSVSHGEWLTKTEELVSLLAPVVGIGLIAVLPLCLTGRAALGGLVMIVNVGLSCSDIFAFFYLLVKMPKNALLLGNRYRLRDGES